MFQYKAFYRQSCAWLFDCQLSAQAFILVQTFRAHPICTGQDQALQVHEVQWQDIITKEATAKKIQASRLKLCLQ